MSWKTAKTSLKIPPKALATPTARKVKGPKDEDFREDDSDDDDDISSLSDDETRADDFSRSEKNSKAQSNGKLLVSKQLPQQTLKCLTVRRKSVR
jgi:hypothetical protein